MKNRCTSSNDSGNVQTPGPKLAVKKAKRKPDVQAELPMAQELKRQAQPGRLTVTEALRPSSDPRSLPDGKCRVYPGDRRKNL